MLTSALLEGEGGKRTKGSSFLNPFSSKIFSSFFAHFLAPSPLSSSLVFDTFCFPTSEKKKAKEGTTKGVCMGRGGKKSHPREKMKKSLFLYSLCTFHGTEGKTNKPFFWKEGLPRNCEKPPRLDASLALLEATRNCPRGLTLLLCKMGQHPPPPPMQSETRSS